MIVFLGGTCESNWRESFMQRLKSNGIEFFNPVVDVWNEEAMLKENEIKMQPDTIELYVVTSEMKGFYSIAEVTQASLLKPDRTIFYVVEDGFDNKQIKSFDAIKQLLTNNGAFVCESFSEIVNILKKIGGNES